MRSSECGINCITGFCCCIRPTGVPARQDCRGCLWQPAFSYTYIIYPPALPIINKRPMDVPTAGTAYTSAQCTLCILIKMCDVKIIQIIAEGDTENSALRIPNSAFNRQPLLSAAN